MKLATAAELALLVQKDLTGNEARANLLLELASGVVQEYCDAVGLIRVNDDEISLAGNWTRQLVLPLGPVHDVIAVSIDGVALASSEYVRAGDRLHGRWGGNRATVLVTYSHGLEIPPASAKAAALRMAGDVLANPHGFTSETLEILDRYTTTVDVARTLGMTLLASEQSQLARYHTGLWAA